MFSLKGKTAVVTGGGSGIGKAIACLFAKQGAIVHIIEMNKTLADATAEEINLFGKAFAHICDVSKQNQVIDVFNEINKIDILVNNAGIAHVGSITTTSEEDFDRVYNVNVKGVYNCAYATIPKMQQQGGGVILTMASVASHVGIKDRFAYSTSKGATFAMSMSIAKDYINDGIRSNTISPARVHTPFVDGFVSKNYPGEEEEAIERLSKTQPIGRMGKPEEVATLALYLCSDEAGFITGSDYAVDGGFIKLNN